ncbi:MAG: hypothetical protein M0004_09910 [Actinomycetota bacterium]|nr:hypothetical protein [Actinomycetota bacterium]
MDLAIRFSTRCATAYRRGSDRTRRLFNAAVLDDVRVRDGHVVEAAYKEPFDLLFSSPKFEYDDVVGAAGLEPLTPCASFSGSSVNGCRLVARSAGQQWSGIPPSTLR